MKIHGEGVESINEQSSVIAKNMTEGFIAIQQLSQRKYSEVQREQNHSARALKPQLLMVDEEWW